MRYEALMAGMIIGIAALGNVVSITGGSTIFGAILFCVGLVTILFERFKLVTGNFGNALQGRVSWRDMLAMFIWNAIGVIIIALLRKLDTGFESLMPTLEKLVAAREARGWWRTILAGAGTGFLIQVAVENYKNNKSAWGIMLPTAMFVFLGWNHCIADIFYYVLAGSCKDILLVLMAALGNFIGATVVTIANWDS